MLSLIFERLKKLFKNKKISSTLFRDEILITLNTLQKILDFQISNPTLYVKALTHRSYLEINPELGKSNERLEFLGDSVLNMIVANYLFVNYDEEGEGFLTKARSALVNRERLFIAAEKLALENIILYNQRYLGDSKEGLQTVLADTVEALIGAIYLDKGLEIAEKFVLKWLVLPYEEDESFLIDTNYKGQLLEYAHAKKMELPVYKVIKIDGPEHKREFTIEVYVGDKMLGIGKGKNKKSAEQNASKIAINNLKTII
ncbi:MAG: ribonuclease III [Bacteroidota bacterium]